MDSLDAGVAAVFRTVITGDLDQIQQAVNNYRDPRGYSHCYYLYQKKDGDGRNLLHYVCMYNTDEVATWMLSLRDDHWNSHQPIPKDSDKFGVTSVMYAARAGMVTFVTEWIKQEYNINTVDKNDRNILHYCCGEGEVIKNLPEARQKQNNIDKDKIQQIVNLLIDKGVNCIAADQKGASAMKYIIDLKFDKCVSLIASNPDKAIHIWKNEAHDTIKVLSSNQIYPCVKLETKPMELYGGFMHLCVKDCFILDPKLSYNQRLKTFEETVLSCKLNVNELDDNGMTALHYLCYYEFDSEPYGLREILVGKMLELGADPNIMDIRGYTPLMCAVEKGYVAIYDLSDPRNVNEQGIGKLLQGNVEDSPKLGLDAPLVGNDFKKQMKYMSQKIKAQEDVFRIELERMNKEQMEIEAAFNREIMTIEATKEEHRLQLQKKLQEQHRENNELKAKMKNLHLNNNELLQKIQEWNEQINGMKSNINDQHITIDELQKKLQEQYNENKDLKCEVKELQRDQNIQNEMQQKLEEKCHEIINLKIKLEELERKVNVMSENQEGPSSSLLLGNRVLHDVARHLEADVEVTCFPDASLEDLQATMSKDDQKYKNVYLITENKSTSSDLNNLIVQYRKLIDASKDKAAKLTVASVLPTLDDEGVNDNIEQLNKELETLCQETGCQFVNNDSTFKFMNGTIIEACFDEDGENLCELGIKQLLKNLGLLTAKKKKMQATNI